MKRYGIDLNLEPEELFRLLSGVAADLSAAFCPYKVVVSGIYDDLRKTPGVRIIGFAIPELGTEAHRLVNAFETHPVIVERGCTPETEGSVEYFPEVGLRSISWEVGKRPFFTMYFKPCSFDKSIDNVFRVAPEMIRIIGNPLYDRTRDYSDIEEAHRFVDEQMRQGEKPNYLDRVLTGRVTDFPRFTR